VSPSGSGGPVGWPTLGAVRLTHLGHACLLVEMGGARILLDPGMFTPDFEKTTGLDAVLITHQHRDHVDADRLPALLAVNGSAALVAEAATVPQLGTVGLRAQPLRPGDELRYGAASVRAVGGVHARIFEDDPPVGNVGLLLSADGEPTLFHPGDCYDVVPERVDVLALPLAAPWTGGRGTIEFLRAVAPPVAVPIHDGLLIPPARKIYVGLVDARGPESTRILDLAGAGAAEVG
jgi:L-ascorbate metabolism protein UlaG (beta-lactamase superfamily)